MTSAVSSEFPEHLRDIGDELSPKYAFVQDIGGGRRGVTYKICSRANPHQHFCLKTIRCGSRFDDGRKSDCRWLRREVAVLSSLSHRCLPAIYDYSFSGRRPYHVCSYQPGMTLAELVRSGKVLPYERGLFTVLSLVDALDYLHRAGRVHRDLHPGNLMIGENVFRQGMMVIDFGSGSILDNTVSQITAPPVPEHDDVEARALNRCLAGLHRSSSVLCRSDFNRLGRLLSQARRALTGGASAALLRSYVRLCRFLQDM